MTRTVRDITTAIASGDSEAFSRFYRQWFGAALAEARRASGCDEQFCLDVVQNTMLRVIRSLKPMDTEAALRAWMRVVVQSCCADLLRTERRRMKRERNAAAASPQALARDLDDRLAWLREQLMTIEPEQRHLLAMRYRMGWTLERIGRALGIKPGAVDGRINRSLASLRASAKEEIHD